MSLVDVGLGWTARSGVVRATFLAPVIACWLMLLISRAGHRPHDVGAGMVVVASLWIVWAGFVTWRIAMNEHFGATARTSASDGLRFRRH